MESGYDIWMVLSFLYGEGTSCDFGCSEENIVEMVALSQEIFPSKPYRVVKHWLWADLKLDQQHLDRYKALGLQPSVIYAKEIVQDGSDRGGVGKSVRTSLLMEFHHGCLFVTRNTTYILVGSGTRMAIHPFVYTNFFF